MNNSDYYNFRSNPRPHYNIPLFNDIHTYFPAVLYDHGRFTSVASLLTYIRDQVRYHSDSFGLAQRDYLYNYSGSATLHAPIPPQPPLPTNVPTPIQSALPASNTFTNYMNWAIPPPPPPPTRPTPTVRLSNDQQFLNSLLNIFNQPDLTLMTGIINLPEPVAITPSNETLAHASEILTATEDHNNVECMVCLEHLVAGQQLRKLTFCRHVFHRQCIDTWFERNIRCPICRHDIRDNVHTNEAESDEEDDTLQEDEEASDLSQID